MRLPLCIVAAALVAFAGWLALVPSGAESQAPVPAPAERTVPLRKFKRAVHLYRREHARAEAMRATLRTRPDFEVSLQLAGIVYGQDWRALERCALSEGYRRELRFERANATTNRSGSGATSSFQFMRGTFLSTPFASLDWTRQDVQAMAAAWMWSRGRRGEWAGAGC